MDSTSTYHRYRELQRELADIHHALAVLNWDQEIFMPEKGAELRGGQMATLSGLAHDKSVAPELGELLEVLAVAKDLDERQHRNVAESKRDYSKRLKYTRSFVERMSKATSEAYHAWTAARAASDFSRFRPQLETIVALKREEAELLGYGDGHPYDALMDAYEPDAKTADIEQLFTDVRAQLVDYVKEIAARPQVDDSFLHRAFDKDEQWAFGLEILEQMGYDFKAGRQDLSIHPFTTSFSPADVRVTTRIDPNNFNDMCFSCIHEGGHALYEQGLPVEAYGLPEASPVSLGIHESQSRLWENNVGRGMPFWRANYANLQKRFPQALGDVELASFYRAINKVKPSLIRTEADELTYHFHVMIRFEIEKALIEGSLEVADLPSAWNEKYKAYLGIDVPDDAHGVLQDIHWSHGSFGYFPTYSLGSFYAAQFFAKAQEAIPGLEERLAGGSTAELLAWLREHIHRHGSLYSARELCMRVTGTPLEFKHFMRYARRKYDAIYGLKREMA